LLKTCQKSYLWYVPFADGKKKLFNFFLKQFLVVYRNWEPINLGQSPEDALNSLSMDNSQQFGRVVVGCSAGHPAEIIHVLSCYMLIIDEMLISFQNM
jgi:hypothetical protein